MWLFRSICLLWRVSVTCPDLIIGVHPLPCVGVFACPSWYASLINVPASLEDGDALWMPSSLFTVSTVRLFATGPCPLCEVVVSSSSPFLGVFLGFFLLVLLASGSVPLSVYSGVA